jgi:outer membrane autotransporter protein
LGTGKSDAFQLGVYGSHRAGSAYISAGVAYAWHRMTTDRTISVGGTDRLVADFSAFNVGGRVEAGRRFDAYKVGITPYAAAQLQVSRVAGYEERALTGSSVFALSFDPRIATAVRTELGFWFDKTYVSAMQMTLRSRLAWAHDRVSDTSAVASFQALPGSGFQVNGARPRSDLLLASAGLEVKLRQGLSVGAKFDGEFASGSRTYTGTGTVRYTW